MISGSVDDFIKAARSCQSIRQKHEKLNSYYLSELQIFGCDFDVADCSYIQVDINIRRSGVECCIYRHGMAAPPFASSIFVIEFLKLRCELCIEILQTVAPSVGIIR